MIVLLSQRLRTGKQATNREEQAGKKVNEEKKKTTIETKPINTYLQI
jgi:hypothetical protein